MHIISNIALISINETLFVEVISFLVFLFLINRIMFRPLQATMKDRDAHILSVENQIKESENALADMTRELKQNELKTIKAAQAQKQTLLNAGSSRAEEVIAAAAEEIQQLKAANQQAVNEQLSAARQTLAEESRKLALSIMERVLDRRLTHG